MMPTDRRDITYHVYCPSSTQPLISGFCFCSATHHITRAIAAAAAAAISKPLNFLLVAALACVADADADAAALEGDGDCDGDGDAFGTALDVAMGTELATAVLDGTPMIETDASPSTMMPPSRVVGVGVCGGAVMVPDMMIDPSGLEERTVHELSPPPIHT